MRKAAYRYRSAVGLLLLAAACAVPACGSDEVPSDLRTKLESDTGVAWGVAVDPRSNAPRILSPSAPVRLGSGTPEADARAFFDRYGKQLGAGGHELRVAVNEPEVGGGTYVRFRHFVPGTGLRLFDVASMAHFDAHGAAYLVQPGFRVGLDAVPHDAKIAADAAVRTATALIVADCGIDASAVPSTAAELGVSADEDAPLALAYRIPFREVTERCLSPQVDVDAITGAVLRVHAGGAALADRSGGYRFYRMGDAKDQKPIDITKHWHPFGDDTYTLETETSPKVITQDFHSRVESERRTNGVTFEQHAPGNWDSANVRAPGAAVDAHHAVTQALRYFQEAHGRHGIDGSNGAVYVVAHDNLGNDNGDNAHYTTIATPAWVFFHVTNDQISVGDGDSWDPPPPVLDPPPPVRDPTKREWMPMSMAFDVMAHEVAHGVTAHTSNLVYAVESGALNESFSDVMGVSADQWLSPERHIGSKAVIGDRLRTDGKPMRDMVDTQGKVLFKAPESTKAMEPCAAQTPANDHCHVHDNSGISNRAWSLMTLGGVHKSSNLTFSSPLGWVKSRVLWYETFTRLSSQATFREAALKQLAWAAQFDPSILNTVGCAWYAVGALTLDATVSPLAASLVCPTAAPGVDGSAPPAPSGPPTTSSGACSGHANGWMCDPAAPSAAYRCNGGAAAGTVSCADLAERCKPRSVTDPTATVDSSGVLTCE